MLIEAGGRHRGVAAVHSCQYDQEFPEYGTVHGALLGPEPGVVTAPPAMWADALDRLMRRVADRHVREVTHLRAIALSAQQHGSVYLNAQAAPRLATLDPRIMRELVFVSLAFGVVLSVASTCVLFFYRIDRRTHEANLGRLSRDFLGTPRGRIDDPKRIAAA